ncbi:hypothetical protein GCM10025868_22150 [Angustibacter aerolatus]|uniref:Uncharacterized protein n=1 Tax=Angustibacter aerolatus TaxID=1162965 RepID=A0ABQ6JJH0_9ACTN|nr:hypothetical protein GCM10025868_22150 [Angustibacter aerolatus]
MPGTARPSRTGRPHREAATRLVAGVDRGGERAGAVAGGGGARGLQQRRAVEGREHGLDPRAADVDREHESGVRGGLHPPSVSSHGAAGQHGGRIRPVGEQIMAATP